jgi:hypothetical protein
LWANLGSFDRSGFHHGKIMGKGLSEHMIGHLEVYDFEGPFRHHDWPTSILVIAVTPHRHRHHLPIVPIAIGIGIAIAAAIAFASATYSATSSATASATGSATGSAI